MAKPSFERIKSNFFLFDTLYTYNFEIFKNLQLNSAYGKKSHFDKVQLLIDQGYLKLFDASDLEGTRISTNNEFNYLQISNILDEEYEKLNTLRNQIFSSESANKLSKLQFQYYALEERLLSLVHQEKTGETLSPVTSLVSYENLDLIFPKANVYRVLINNFPIPDESIPLVDIIQYKNEESNKLNFLRLRSWVNNISQKELSEIEIAEEIEILIAENKREMELAGMKYKNAKIEFLIKLVPNLVEKIAKISLNEMFDPYFKVRNEKISLLETENKAKGNELAYVIKSSSLG